VSNNFRHIPRANDQGYKIDGKINPGTDKNFSLHGQGFIAKIYGVLLSL